MTSFTANARVKRRMLLPVLGGLFAACLLVWQTLASEPEPLQIQLQVPDICEIEADADTVSPTLQVGWQVSGGVAPYRVFVHGDYREAPAGEDLTLCGIWNDDDVQSGQMPILGSVIDANGDAASALAYAQAVKVINADPRSGISEPPLVGGQTYRIHGVLLTIPPDVRLRHGSYVSYVCRPEDAVCGDEFPLTFRSSTLWLRRWHHDESRREIYDHTVLVGVPGYNPDDYDDDLIKSVFDQIVASIGRNPAADRAADGFSQLDSPELEIVLQAPRICETHWGSYGGRRQSIQVEWEVSGGRAPYRVQFRDRWLKVDASDRSGVIGIPCGLLRDDADGVDSQVMNTQAIVVDADGATSSGVVSTYAISAGRYGGDTLRGGWTHRMQGLLMTIPDGLEFHVETIGSEEVSCGENVCTHRGCLDSGQPICENSWSMGTIGNSVWVGFGYTSHRLFYRRVDSEQIAMDPGVTLSTPEEVHAAIDAIADSIGEPPQLPEWGVYNPAPLRIWAWPDPITCSPTHDGTTAQRRVAGGGWWPLGIGDQAWQEDLKLARLECGAGLGWHENTLEVHEGGPDGAMAETTVRHLAYPTFGDTDVLQVFPHVWSTDYCEPGSEATIWWDVYRGEAPYSARVNGVLVEMRFDEELGFATGWYETKCADRLGLQRMTVEVWDSADPPHRVTFPIILKVVEEHPSGRPWSDFR